MPQMKASLLGVWAAGVSQSLALSLERGLWPPEALVQQVPAHLTGTDSSRDLSSL